MKFKLLNILILFVVVNLATIGISYLVLSDFDLQRIQVGWPFKIYERFQVSGSNFLNYGWYPKHVIYNEIIYLVCAVTIVGLISLRRNQNRK